MKIQSIKLNISYIMWTNRYIVYLFSLFSNFIKRLLILFKKTFFFFSINFFLWCLLLFVPSFVYWNIFTQIKIDTHTLQYITYPINSEEYNIHVGISSEGSTLREILGDYGGVSGINGVFFCPADYSQCKGKNYTINERFIEGREISTYDDTGERVVFWWDESEIPFLHQTNSINSEKRWNIYEWFANFPLLLQSWENKLEHYYDIGLIGKKMRSPITRHFICTNQERNEIIFGRVHKATLDDVVKVIWKIGCYDAINLDAWNSSAFIYNGRNIVGPGRDILDGVVITRNNVDTKKIHANVKNVFKKIESIYLKKRNKTKAIEQLQAYRTSITQLRTNIYKKYSRDVIDTQGDTIWYTVEVKNRRVFTHIYLLNLIDHEIKILIQKLKDLSSLS